MNGSDDLPLIPSDLEALGSGRRQIAQKLLKTEGRQLCKICVLSFCHISGSNEKTVMMTGTQKAQLTDCRENSTITHRM
jgi:hypothetical protein